MKSIIIPRKTLFGDPVAMDALVSPDGMWLSWIAPFEGVLNIWKAPIGDIAQSAPITQTKGRPIWWHMWSQDSRFVLFTNDENGDENSHLFAADAASGELRDLTPLPDIAVTLMMASPDRPDEILVGINDRDPSWHDVWSINIATGERTLLWENTQELSSFGFDWLHQLRFATTSLAGGGARILRIENGALTPWIDIPYADSLTTYANCFNRANTHLYFASSLGRNTNAVYRINWETGEQELLAAHNKADISNYLFDPKTFQPIAIAAEVHRQEWIYVADNVKPDFARIIARFPEHDFYIRSQSKDGKIWVIGTHKADEPAVFYLYQRNSGTIIEICRARPDLAAFQLAPMHAVDGKSRDGLWLPTYLTLPTEETGTTPKQPLPMVLLVHGGPWGRDDYGYSGYAQWLANRGYAVLSVNYRGSTGFGKAFIEASTGEHGRKMHDDLIDMVNWAIDEGIAHKDKVAIMGASYGGYASFLGATFTPDVFCCAVPIVGITNLQTLLENKPPYWASFAEFVYQSYGDLRTEEGRKLLAERSPIYKVDRVKIPMLIFHGANDVRCTIAESDTFVEAMKAKGIPGIYVVYPDEGHGFEQPANRLSHMALTEAFLAQHLGGRFEAFGGDLEGSSHEIRWGSEQLASFLTVAN